jgi:hypothetical protein
MVGQNDNALHFRREGDAFNTHGRKRCPYRQLRTGGHDAESGLDALGDAEDVIAAYFGEANRTTAHGPKHHAGVVDVRLAVAVCAKPYAVDRDSLTTLVSDDCDHRRMAGAALPMCEACVKQEIGRRWNGEVAGLQVLVSYGANDRHRSRDDRVDLTPYILARRLRSD